MKSGDQIKIGTFSLGWENVELYGMVGEKCGEFYFCPEENRLPRIKIGLNYARWDDLVGVLLHETFEFLMLRLELGYRPMNKTNGDTSNRIFLMDHSQFGECCSRQATFLVDALPKLAVAWKKATKPKRGNQ